MELMALTVNKGLKGIQVKLGHKDQLDLQVRKGYKVKKAKPGKQGRKELQVWMVPMV
jgi:hypothetical protein